MRRKANTRKVLSDRERQVCEVVGKHKGITYNELARKMGVSIGVAKLHFRHAKAKGADLVAVREDAWGKSRLYVGGQVKRAVKLSETEGRIYAALLEEDGISTEALSRLLGVKRAVVNAALYRMRQKGVNVRTVVLGRRSCGLVYMDNSGIEIEIQAQKEDNPMTRPDFINALNVITRKAEREFDSMNSNITTLRASLEEADKEGRRWREECNAEQLRRQDAEREIERLTTLNAAVVEDRDNLRRELADIKAKQAQFSAMLSSFIGQ